MRTKRLLHLSIAGTVASFTAVFVQSALTGDWSPVLAGCVGLAAALLYLVGSRALPHPQWLRVFPEEITQWLKEYGQTILILLLSVSLLVIAITIWTRGEPSTIEQAVFEQSSVTQPVEEVPIAKESVVEKPTAEEQQSKYLNPELRTQPMCPLGLMPDLVNCDDLERAVEDCGLYAVRSGELTHPKRADPRDSTWSFRGCLRGWRMSWKTCSKGEKNCYLFEYTGEKGFRDMRDFEGH